jgi:uncharacterized repeat protein (TIGR03806 family)
VAWRDALVLACLGACVGWPLAASSQVTCPIQRLPLQAFDPTVRNVAPSASIVASSENSDTGQLAIKAVDQVVDGWPGDFTREWATTGQGAGAWIELTWSTPHAVQGAVLHDRPGTNDHVLAGTLSFSDGTTVSVGALDNAGAAIRLSFASRTVTWVRFTVDAVASTTSNIGLAELEILGTPVGGSLPEFVLTPAFPDLVFERPVFLTFSPDQSDRLFVVEQAGRLKVFDNDASASSATVFLDITDRVKTNFREQGLLGLAFDPDYATNGFFYLNYTAPWHDCSNEVECTKIVRFESQSGDPLQADPQSALEILEYDQPDDDHNAGMMAFGPDGYLYIASGDGGNYPGATGQDTSTRLGAILRIDPGGGDPYAIPPDNPFTDDPGQAAEIWHFGLRNPWRFSFDRVTGDLWIGDVGQNSWEEIDYFAADAPGGANLGWPTCEGNHDFAGSCASLGATPPVFEYSHTSGLGQAVVGGYVYRGARFPELSGRFFFGDAVSGRVFAWDGGGAPVSVGAVPALSSFGEDEQGELYALALLSGQIFRIEYTTGEANPGLPQLLSDTGLFDDIGSLTPAPGLIPYDVRVPFWSDHAIKRRWIGLPGDSSADFHPFSAWEFPTGSVAVKHFDVPIGPGQNRRLETRVMLKQSDVPETWIGGTYRWNAAQTEAELLTNGVGEQINIDLGSGLETQDYYFPAPSECLQCHNAAAGHLLGLQTAQMNRSLSYAGGDANQLEAWSCAGLLTPNPGDPALHEALIDPGDPAEGLATRARHWLDVNCSMCHRPGGPAPGGLGLQRTALLGDMSVIDVPPTEGGLGLPDPRRIFVGSKEQSVLWERVSNPDPALHMPPQSRAADPLATDLLGTWIDTALFVLDSDDDGEPDASDNCPHVPNDQVDAGGVGLASAADGIGDACQCGDVSGDGFVTDADATTLRQALAGAGPPADPALCDVFPGGAEPGRCDLEDAVVLARIPLATGPDVQPICHALAP